jgi:hypothetical protein
MRIVIPLDASQLAGALPPTRADGSGAGVNFADALLKCLKATLPDGRRLTASRRGLRITITIGDARGAALLRRLEDGPDPRVIVERALAAAAREAGATLHGEAGVIVVEVPDPDS